MPTVQTGARGTVDLVAQAIVQEIMSRVAQLEPSAGTLTTLMNMLEKTYPTDNPDPQHLEDELLPNIDLVNGAQTAADTNIEVDNPAFYLVGDILHIPRTGENMRVTVAPGTSPITVVRGVGSMPAAINDNEEMWILGGAQRENDTSRNALNTLEVVATTRCQIVRNSIEGAGTQLATRQHGGDFEEQFEKKLIEHKRQLDYFFKFGTASVSVVAGENLRTMEGLNHHTQINRVAVDGVLGEGEFDAIAEMAAQNGSDTKICQVSPRVGRSIQNFAKSRMVTVPMDESYGMQIREYYTQGINLWIVVDRELKGAVYSGHMMIWDPAYKIIRYLRAADDGRTSAKYVGNKYCKRVTHIQPNDQDGRKDEIFSELGFQMIHERVDAIASGIQG